MASLNYIKFKDEKILLIKLIYYTIAIVQLEPN